MTDDDDRVAATRHDLRHVLCRRAGPQQLDRLCLGARGARDLVGRLAGAQQRAREHGVGRDAFLGEARAELPRGRPAVGRQPTQLVGLALLGLRVANKVQPHVPQRLAMSRPVRYMTATPARKPPPTQPERRPPGAFRET